MASDLLKTQQLKGKSRADVLAMLGEPDSVRARMKDRRSTYAYALDGFYLRIWFDENDLVEDAVLASD
jgi:hypothetical protein